MRIAPLVALALVTASPAFAQSSSMPTGAAAVAADHYSVENTDIGTLLDDPAAKAVLDKHISGFSSNGQIDMARSMTLKGIQQYSAEQMTDKVLADIQVDLNKLPTKK